MKDIFDSSLQELRSRISDVKYTAEGISFLLDNVKYSGILKGRNSDLVLGLNLEADKAIALRVLLDGDVYGGDESHLVKTLDCAGGEIEERIGERRE